MDNSSQDLCNGEEGDGDGRNNTCSMSSTSSSPSYRLFGRQSTIHQLMGGGKVADVILWKRQHESCGIIVVATIAWLIFQWSGLSFFSICSDVLLSLIVVLFLRANYAVFTNKQLQTLHELVLSEEMVNNAAASFRVKINQVLVMAHDIAFGNDFRVFLKVVVCLWLLSLIGSLMSFFTLAYVGTILSVTLPALYNKFEDPVDQYANLISRQFSRQYKFVDESVMSRFPPKSVKDKDS